jgi:hypothetical protein
MDLNDHGGFIRYEKWRPLSKKEIERFVEEKKIRQWMNKGVISNDEVYWIQKKHIL